MSLTVDGELIQDVQHLGRVELLTPKPAESLRFFREVLGLEVVHEEGGSVFLRGYGDYAVSTIKLTGAPAGGVGCISWRAASPKALERRAEAIAAAGLGLGWTNGDFGRGRAYRFRDPDGHEMDLYYEEQRYEPPPDLRSALKNQPMRFTGRGVNARRIDHLALLASDVPTNRRFMEEVLGFRLHEQVRFNDGRDEIGSWLSPSIMHHQVAYVLDVKRAHGRLHHFALWVDSREDVLRAADLFMEHGIFIEAGPSKHNNSQGFYLYAYEPGGNRIEIYSGSYAVFAPDFKPVTWNEQERGTGVYWGTKLPESFIAYGTPDVPAQVSAEVPVFDPR